MSNGHMEVHCLFIQRKQDYDGQYGPEVLTAWDEYSADDNREGFNADVEKCLKSVEGDIEGHAMITLNVPLAQVFAILRPEGTIEATAVPME